MASKDNFMQDEPGQNESKRGIRESIRPMVIHFNTAEEEEKFDDWVNTRDTSEKMENVRRKLKEHRELKAKNKPK